ncbi:MAG: TetR family transcriptional regulator [Chloroflexota bacterium]
MKRTKEDADVTRQGILAAALRLFSKYGYEATKLEDIAEAAKVTRGAIYHHFGGKVGLYNELTDRVMVRLKKVAEDAVAAGGSSLDILRRVTVQILVSSQQDSEIRAIQELMLQQPVSEPALRENWEKRIENGKQTLMLFEEGFQEAIDHGEVRADVSPRTAALAMIGIQNGLFSLWLVDQTLFSLEEEANQAIDIFLRGIATN